MLLRYRSVDGGCNNFINTRWGATSKIFRRILPAQYPDGMICSLYRLHDKNLFCLGKGAVKTNATHTRNGQPIQVELQNARTLSKKLHQLPFIDDPPRQSEEHSHMTMQFGQFIDHDITLTPEPGNLLQL